MLCGILSAFQAPYYRPKPRQLPWGPEAILPIAPGPGDAAERGRVLPPRKSWLLPSENLRSQADWEVEWPLWRGGAATRGQPPRKPSNQMCQAKPSLVVPSGCRPRAQNLPGKTTGGEIRNTQQRTRKKCLCAAPAHVHPARAVCCCWSKAFSPHPARSVYPRARPLT